MLIFYKLNPSDKEAVACGKAVILDVRSPEEFNTSHVSGATNFDVELIEAGKYPEIELDKPIFAYCRSGARSERATQILHSAGYKYVKNIGGLDEVNNQLPNPTKKNKS